MKSIAVILGSAYLHKMPEAFSLAKVDIPTSWGRQEAYKMERSGAEAWVFFRHGLPHRLLPNQINYRAQAGALKAIGCGALLTTSSVGVLDSELPLFEPLLLSDLMMPENRLPDGSTCTMFDVPARDHGHLVLSEGLFSEALNKQVRQLGQDCISEKFTEVTFAYAGGPRGKTPAENVMWSRLGAQVNSMTLAPEVVLANELEIPCAGLVAGHKYSVPGMDNPQGEQDVNESLERCRNSMETVILNFLREGEPVPFGNHVYRFNR